MRCVFCEVGTEITNSMEESPTWEADSHSASQEIPRLLWNPKFITFFTKARHWFWARSTQSTTYQPFPLRSNLILSLHLSLRLLSDVFTSGFPTIILCVVYILTVSNFCNHQILGIVTVHTNFNYSIPSESFFLCNRMTHMGPTVSQFKPLRTMTSYSVWSILIVVYADVSTVTSSLESFE
jgi:hypothetical protein